MDIRERPRGSFIRHPWETSRCRFFQGLLDRRILRGAPAAILDVGSGDAWFAQQLVQPGSPETRIVCWDTGYTDHIVSELSSEAPDRVEFSDVRPAGRFDVILLLDVLEHIEDDAAVLTTLVEQNLEPGGRVLVSVPAHPWLYSQHDRNLGHYRRYSSRALRGLLQRCGLAIQQSGGLFHGLLPVRAAQSLVERVRGTGPPQEDMSHQWRFGSTSARIVEWVLSVDNAVSLGASRLGLDLPGLSVWAICDRSV
jgi:SAM-dependent methyltransferase